MGYMQRTRILSDSELDDNTTWRERLDLTGKVTAIEMRITADRAENRASVNTVFTLADTISRIELLRDATTPLLSLTGTQLDAMNYWELRRPNARRYRQLDARDNILTLFLMGGRSLYDREYGWDFDTIKKAYLEYTYNQHEDTAEYFESNTHDIDLYVWEWKGGDIPSFRGYFRSKQLDAWTTSAENAVHTIEIPPENPIRRVCLQAKTRATTLGGTFSQLDLRVGKGLFSPVIIKSPMDWVLAEVSEYDLHNVIGGIDYLYTDAGHDLPYWFSYYQDGVVAAYASVAVHPEVTSLLQIPATIARTAGQDGEVVFRVSGFGFQKCLRIGFDHEADGFDLLRVPSGKALDLVVTEADDAESAACFVQDVVSY